MPNKVFALEGNGSRPSHLGDGYSESDVSYTLNHVEQHGVCYGVVSKGNGDAFLMKEKHTTLGVGGGQAGQGYPAVCYNPNDRNNFVFTQNQREEVRDLGDIAGSLSADRGTHQQTLVSTPICYGIGSYGSNAWKSGNPHSGVYVAETARTLDALQCGNPSCNQGGVAIVEEK